MPQNSSAKNTTDPTFKLGDLLKLTGPAQLITVVDDDHDPDAPIYSGKVIRLRRSDNERHMQALLREVRHINTTDDDRAFMNVSSPAGAALVGENTGREAVRRCGIMIHLM